MKKHLTGKRIVAIVAALAALTGVGATVAPMGAAARTASLDERQLVGPGLPDFTQFTCPGVVTDPSGLTVGRVSASSLRANGFVEGLQEQLHSTLLGADARISVIRFRTAAGARSELALASRDAGAQRVAPIPGARGVRLLGHGREGYAVFFARRRLLYGVDVGFRRGSATPVSKAQVVLAAAALSERVR